MILRYSRPEMIEVWDDQSKYQLWLEIETLALEQMVNEGIAPTAALKDVRERGAFNVDRILDIEKTVKHGVIAFLTNVAEHVGAGARYLHFGMTSSDLLDTAFSVQLCRATDLILNELDELLESIREQAMQHRYTLCIGRSHGIHAEPTTFGLKTAGWFAELERQRSRLCAAREDIAVGAISGPVGTFAHLPPSVEEHVCKCLGLKPASISTQVIPRDHHAMLFSAFAQLGNSLERIAIEIRHLQRTEVRELEEPFTVGQKGSSAMPHKRNPILTENITGLARLLRGWASMAMENVALWHERDISHSSVERVIGPDMTTTLHFMLGRLKSVLKDLRVYEENMRYNLELTGGLYFSGTLLVALADKGLSREDAYRLVQKHALAAWEMINAAEDGATFADRVRNDEEIKAAITPEDLDELFSLDRHMRHVDFIFERVFGVKQ